MLRMVQGHLIGGTKVADLSGLECPVAVNQNALETRPSGTSVSTASATSPSDADVSAGKPSSAAPGLEGAGSKLSFDWLQARSHASLARLQQAGGSRRSWIVAGAMALALAIGVLLQHVTLISAAALWTMVALLAFWRSAPDDMGDASRQSLPAAGPPPTSEPETDQAAGSGDSGSQHTIGQAPTVQPVVAELHWRAVIDALPDPVVLLDGEGYIVHFNPPVADIFPRARQGLPIASLTRSPDLLRAIEGIGDGDPHRVVQLEDRVPVARHWSAIVSAVSSEAQPMHPRSMVLFRDLTEQQRHVQQRTDFIAHASHELRTPLASLKSMVETLQRHAATDPDARDRFLAMMQDQAARMARLIDDLLILSRAEMRAHVAPTNVLDLSEVVAYVCDGLEAMAQGAELELTLKRMDQPAWVRGDRDDLVQVFQNLVQNAIKYNNEGGFVRVEMERVPGGARRRDQIMVSVKDNGPGIADENISRITERFFRVSVTASRNKGGTGLGLAIVKYLVNRHRGQLRVRSKLGQGSTFSVLLDACDGPQQLDLPPPMQL